MVHVISKILEVRSPVCGNRVVKRFFWFASFSLAAAALFASAVCAQEPASSRQPTSQSSSAEAQSATPALTTSITIPAGTQIEMVLTQDVDSRALHRGDQIHAQITNPVTAGEQAVIPPGSFVQGKIEKLSATRSRANIALKSVSVILPDGEVLPIPGPVEVQSGEYTAWSNPSDSKRLAATLAPMIGGGVGTLIGSRFHTTDTLGSGPLAISMTHTPTKALAIGSFAGLGAGLAVMAALLHTHQFYMAAGSPVEMGLPSPVVVSPGAAPPPGN